MKKVEQNSLMINKKVLFPVVGVVLFLALALAAYLKFGVVAVVNGRRISRMDYITLMEKQVGEQTLDQLVTEEMILSKAESEGVSIDDETINNEIADIEKNIESQGQKLEEALEAEGMTRADLERQIRIRLLVEKMSGDVSEASEEEIQAFLTENKDLLPKDATKEELNELAKEQVMSQKESERINNWLSELEANSKVIYR